MRCIDEAFELIRGSVVAVDAVQVLRPVSVVATRRVWQMGSEQIARRKKERDEY